MELDATQHPLTEQPAQKGQRGVLVHVVHAAQAGRLAQLLQQVAQIVQQGRRHQVVVSPLGLGQGGALQRVLQLRHGLAAVLLCAAAGEQGFDVVEGQHLAGSFTASGVGSRG